jgi:hypothetical protein
MRRSGQRAAEEGGLPARQKSRRSVGVCEELNRNKPRAHPGETLEEREDDSRLFVPLNRDFVSTMNVRRLPDDLPCNVPVPPDQQRRHIQLQDLLELRIGFIQERNVVRLKPAAELISVVALTVRKRDAVEVAIHRSGLSLPILERARWQSGFRHHLRGYNLPHFLDGFRDLTRSHQSETLLAVAKMLQIIE